MYAARSSSFGTFNWATHFEMVCLGAGLCTAITSSSHCLQVVALSLSHLTLPTICVLSQNIELWSSGWWQHGVSSHGLDIMKYNVS